MNRRFGAPAGAVFSRDRAYRYLLWRNWSTRGPLMLFVGLNPSTADEFADDPTIRRCTGFARELGARGLVVANLYAFRATKPVALFAAHDPVGARNDHWLAQAHAWVDIKVACWGVHGEYENRAQRVIKRFDNVYCLGVTQGGQPRHPLYLKRGTQLQKFSTKNHLKTKGYGDLSLE